jgi:hypothetical protein
MDDLLVSELPSGLMQIGSAVSGEALTAESVPFLLGVAAALLACAVRPVWRLTRLVVTAVHELGHAMVVVLLGGQVGRVDLWSSAAGLTTFTLPRHFGRVRGAAVALSGYPAPGLAGLLGAVLVVAGLERPWLWLAAAVTTILLLLWVRNAWGMTTTAAAAVLLGWLAYTRSDRTVSAVGSALATLLLVGGWRAAVTHFTGREHGGRRASDAGLAARMLPAPAPFWSGVFLITATATLAAGAWLLSGVVTNPVSG